MDSTIQATKGRRGATALLLALLVLPVTATAVNSYVPPQEPTLYLRYGKDAYLQQSDVNIAFRESVCTPNGAVASCDASSLTGTSYAQVRRTSGGTSNAEAGVGFRYQVNQSCAAQTLRGVPTVRFTYDYQARLTTGVAPATGSASIQTRLANITDTAVTANTTTVPGTVASGTNVNAARPFTGFNWNVAYNTTIATRATIAYVNQDDLEGPVALANATLTLKRMDLLFGDVTPPAYNSSATSADTTPEEPTAPPATPVFDGWYQAPVTLRVDARDPDNSNVTQAATEPISCVDRVVLHDTDTNQDRVLLPGWAQVPIETTYTEDRKHLIELLVYDGQGNQGVVTKRYFGVDQTAPATSVRVYPTNASGEDGWYKRFPSNASGPVFWLSCSDHTTAASQCEEVRRIEGASNVSVSTTEMANGYTVPEGNRTFILKSKDHAGNWESNKTLVMKVDVTPPQVNLTPDVASGPVSTWYNRTLNVSANCWDATSGCALATLDTGEGSGPQTLPPGATVFPVTTPGLHTFTWYAADRAGNNATGSRAFNVDLVDPTAPNLTAPAHNGFVPNRFWVRWNASTDVGSGIDHYDLRVDNGTITNVGNVTQKELVLVQGRHCVQLRAVDKAGRTSPWTGAGNWNETAERRCFTVDATRPTVALEKPAGGKVTLFDNETTVPGLPANRAIVIGAFWARARASDALSGIERIQIRNVQTTDPGMVTCWYTTVCERSYNRTSILSPPQLVTIEANAWDNATNAAAPVTREVVAVVVHANTLAPASPTAAPGNYYTSWRSEIFWQTLDDEGTFQAYEVHRSNLPDFLPSALTLVTRVEDPTQNTHREIDLLAGQDYYYRIRYVTPTWYVDSHVTHVNTVDGGAGEPGQCGTLGCQRMPYY